MSMPSSSRLIRILQDRLEGRELESSDTKEALLDSFSNEQRQLLGDAMLIAWEEGYDQAELDSTEDSDES